VSGDADEAGVLMTVPEVGGTERAGRRPEIGSQGPTDVLVAEAGGWLGESGGKTWRAGGRVIRMMFQERSTPLFGALQVAAR